MQAGTLSSRVTILRRITGVDEIGQPIDTTETVATVWADIRTLGGLESIKGGGEVSISKASIRIRNRTGIDAGMTALCGGVTYEIKAVPPYVARREFMDLVCEVVA